MATSTVTNAVVAPDLKPSIGFTPDEVKNSSISTTTHEQERRPIQGMWDKVVKS